VSGYSRADKLTLAATCLVLVGSFLPWASVRGNNVYGIEGDGAITAGLAVVGLLFVLLGRWASRPGRLAVAQAILPVLVGIVVIADWTSFAAYGLYLVVGGVGLWLGGATYGLTQGRTARDAPPRSL
jgi:hypothetical protein